MFDGVKSALARRKIRPTLEHLRVEFPVHRRNLVLEMKEFQEGPQIGIVVDMTRVQVVPSRPFKQRRILGNDSQSLARILQTSTGRAERVNTNMHICGFDYSEQCESLRTLPRACSTHDPNLFPLA